MTVREYVRANKDKMTRASLIEGAVRACKVGADRVKEVIAEECRAKPAEAAVPPAAPQGAFALRGVALLSKRPQDSMKARFYGLKRGMGYLVESLAQQWHVSQETIRKHAREYGALKYVEARPGEWAPCVVHPETATGDQP